MNTLEIKNNHINYVEFKAGDLEAIKAFYGRAFDWVFTDYGPDYISFSESGLDGGFSRSAEAIAHGALLVLYHKDLSRIRETVIAAGGKIALDIFSFPGGRRFHFLDPAGNELAVWSDN